MLVLHQVEEIQEYISLISQRNKEMSQVQKLITSKPASAVSGMSDLAVHMDGPNCAGKSMNCDFLYCTFALRWFCRTHKEACSDGGRC